MIRAFRTGLETAEIQSDRIFKITNTALIIVSENSLKNAAEIFKGIINNIKVGPQSDNPEIINIHFFIEEKKTKLINGALSLLAESTAFKEPSDGLVMSKPVNASVNLYKKLSENFFIKNLFSGYDYILFFLAVGAVVRIIAPFLKDKFRDPGVVAIDEGGKFVVSLLSGHTGGANKLAADVAGYIGGGAVPVITTATDATENFSLDMFADKLGLFIEDGMSKIKIFNKASLNGEPIDLLINDSDVFNVNIKKIRLYINGFKNAKKIKLFKDKGLDIYNPNNKKTIIISFMEFLKNTVKMENLVFLRPKCLILGIGCNKNTSFEEIESFISALFGENHLSLNSIRNIATINLKKNETGLLEFGYKYSDFIDYYDKDEINAFISSNTKNNKNFANNKLEQSASFKYTGAYSVCEPCAAMSANSGGKLLIKKQKKGNVTAAVALVNKICQ